MATMNDIALALGISKGTVSKALSGAPDISETMRNAIIEKAVAMGYSRVRRSEVQAKVCILVTHMNYLTEDDFGHDILLGFRQLAEPSGFDVDIIDVTEDLQQQTSFDEFILRDNYAGAFCLGINDSDPWMDDIRKSSTPTVLFDNPAHGNPMLAQVGIDNMEAMKLAVDHLWQLGHRQISYLSSGAPRVYIYEQRLNAYLAAMHEHGVKANDLIGVSPFTSECITIHLPRLLDSGCTAILCNHDLLAQAILTHCDEAGIRVPEQLSVIGFDDIPLCRFTHPPLTSVRQNRTQLGKSAFYALQSQMNHTPISQLTLHAELMVRGSTGHVSSLISALAERGKSAGAAE